MQAYAGTELCESRLFTHYTYKVEIYSEAGSEDRQISR